MSIILTESAAKRISNQIEKNDAFALRFGANESGCSGFSYVMDFAKQQKEDDLVFESFGVKILIDPKSHKLLSGTQIDYVSEGLNQTFKFSNPKATDYCGCGESFAINPAD